MMLLPTQIQLVFDRLESAGFEVFLVGGAVRDYVRSGSPAQDWDMTTNALPEQVKAVFSDYPLIETGLQHGTVTVLVDQTPIEITTYRIDGKYTDHRHPDKVSFTGNLKDDLQRRDFTMNALAYHPRSGVVDLVGGQSDIAQGLVRCVGDPDRRFQEDGLRILRALRFAAVYEMQIEPATAEAIHRNKQLLADISVERVQTELNKLLCGAGAAEIMTAFADVLFVVLPELAPLHGLNQQSPYHDKDVWGHSVASVAGIAPDPILRWAALLHDVGKPGCFSVDDRGIGHFWGHAARSTVLADAILARLRYDNASRERIVQLVRDHDLPMPPDRKSVKRLLHRFGVEGVRQLIALQIADCLGQSDFGKSFIPERTAVSAQVDALLAENACFSLQELAIDGNDLLALGYSGKQIGQTLQACLDAVIEEQLPNEHAALLAFAASHQNET